ncbi:monooxygenase [Polyangium jinanense]|uniref:Monooxygenase n=2 Tax=Polyangium jinanense TaxID=2829994 RepID=A0A9X3XFW3_9BACT|nr:monooxygenase [Polyangium jinanense]MDC3988650.1 monooxygenase [Polyangium jinanense]
MVCAGMLSALPLVVGCGSDGGSGGAAGGPPADAVTYWEHIKPVLDAKCNNCHTQGGIAPFSLETYADAAPLRGLIKQTTEERTMPPWPAAKGCNDYLGDRSLTDDQITLLGTWADGGGIEGDPAKEGAPIDPGPGNPLSRVDRTLEMPVEYTPTKAPDDYRCFVVDWPDAETSYVAGFRANPGNARVVHHVIAYLVEPAQVAELEALDAAEDGPGYTCYGGANVKASWLGSWAPGSLGADTAEGTGIRVDPGSKIVLQIHYNTLAAGAEPDRTSVDFRLEKSVTKEAKIQPWANPSWLQGNGMLIPAGEADVKHAFAADPTALAPNPGPLTVYSAGLHMHTLGAYGSLRIERADGSSECLLDIPKWNFHWQGAYEFVKPMTLNPGDKLSLECHWDNTAENQPVVDGVKMPPKDVTWGEGTTDEMCLGTFYLTR